MILKRFQYWATENGKPIKKFSDWFEYDDHDELLSKFQKEEKYQLNSRLINEFKIK